MIKSYRHLHCQKPKENKQLKGGMEVGMQKRCSKCKKVGHYANKYLIDEESKPISSVHQIIRKNLLQIMRI